MLKIFLYLQISIIVLGSLTAQNFIGKANPSFSASPSVLAETDTLRILGVMVSFQTDRDETTFGNGKFGSIYSNNYGNTIIDPLPHDRNYFAAHMDFVKNYFTKVSKGKLVVEYNILPDTFSVPKVMRDYSPAINSTDFTPVAQFATKVWEMADSIYINFDFSNYDLFSIFHAGVGRDISLPGSIGNEKDIPSIYIGVNSPQKISIPVSGGSFVINNSMIIPETESRELTAIDGSKVLFEISINGLIAASVASHLGLPDLFNTETGLSAIGRFGLMDGQSIFAYNGLFPPEPSAWEKIRMGWAEPVMVNLNSSNINLAANLAASVSDTVILKVPINSSEYFLIENRIRDTRNDGARLTILNNGFTSTRVFTKDTTGFYSFDIDSVEGIVTDVDEFDWALPGNGIVIWHIDENVIDSKLAENKVNNDKKRRGVDVEEADGVQDIGEQFKTILGDIVIGEGIQQDFWYRSNPADLFSGSFSIDTRPNTNSNSGANSLITISNFSDISNKMSFTVSFGDSTVKPLLSSNLNLPSGTKKITNSSGPSVFSFDLISDSMFYRFNQDTVLLIDGNFSSFKTASVEINGGKYSIGLIGNEFKINSAVTGENTIIHLQSGESFSAGPVIRKNNQDIFEIIVGTTLGRILIYSLANFPGSISLTDSVAVSNSPIKKIAADELILAVTDSSFHLYPEIVGTPKILEPRSISEPSLSNMIKDGILDRQTPVILNEGNQFKIRHPDHSVTTLNISSSAEINNFSMADLKNDGNNYILFTDGNVLHAINLQGAVADNFPFTDPQGMGFTGTPLAADFEGDNKSEVIGYTKDGRIFAFDGGTGKVIDGFPISAGAELAASPVVFNYRGKASLAAIDVKNNLSVWCIGSIDGNLFWAEENGSNFNSSFVEAPLNSNRIAEFFPSNRAYNYPNPVYDGMTQIRYYVSEDSKINIKIFDLAGDFVAELNNDARGGFDNETIWNVNDIQSGVYLARIEATGTSGKTEINIIKIAVIK